MELQEYKRLLQRFSHNTQSTPPNQNTSIVLKDILLLARSRRRRLRSGRSGLGGRCQWVGPKQVRIIQRSRDATGSTRSLAQRQQRALTGAAAVAAGAAGASDCRNEHIYQNTTHDKQKKEHVRPAECRQNIVQLIGNTATPRRSSTGRSRGLAAAAAAGAAVAATGAEIVAGDAGLQPLLRPRSAAWQHDHPREQQLQRRQRQQRKQWRQPMLQRALGQTARATHRPDAGLGTGKARSYSRSSGVRHRSNRRIKQQSVPGLGQQRILAKQVIASQRVSQFARRRRRRLSCSSCGRCGCSAAAAGAATCAGRAAAAGTGRAVVE